MLWSQTKQGFQDNTVLSYNPANINRAKVNVDTLFRWIPTRYVCLFVAGRNSTFPLFSTASQKRLIKGKLARPSHYVPVGLVVKKFWLTPSMGGNQAVPGGNPTAISSFLLDFLIVFAVKRSEFFITLRTTKVFDVTVALFFFTFLLIHFKRYISAMPSLHTVNVSWNKIC